MNFTSRKESWKEDCDTNQIIKIIDNLKSAQEIIGLVSLIGGEPTNRKDFFEITDYLEKSDISFQVVTNGVKLKQSKFQKLFLNKKFSKLVVSLESSNPETEFKIRGQHTWRHVIDGLKEASKIKEEYKLNYKIMLNTIVSKANMHELNSIIDMALNLKLDGVQFLELMEDGNAITNNEILSLNYDEMEKIIYELAKRYTKDKDEWKQINFSIQPKFIFPTVVSYVKTKYGLEFPMPIHGCNAGFSFAYIDSGGFLYPCDRYVPEIFEKYKTDIPIEKHSLINSKFEDIIRSKMFQKVYERVMNAKIYDTYNPCNKCAFLTRECFPCSIYGYFHEKINKPFCQKNIKYSEANKKTLLNKNNMIFSSYEDFCKPIIPYKFTTKYNINGHNVLSNYKNSKSLILNEVGNFIWDKIDGQKRGKEICDILVEKYNIGIEKITKDVNQYLSVLKTEGFIY
jgi:radical SAM protein with 4Fe4S-binding SPASM domain